ncbi:CBS domain-containing protein [bacterium SCSIO 12643]|nr:CBS domain-containing protein [bacterium SCSIO 12643]
MTASEVADIELPYLETVDTCDKAMGFMDEFKLSHYPVVNGSVFVGLVYEEDIFELSDWGQTLAQSKLRLPSVSIQESEHFLSVVRKVQTSKLSCIPVIDEKNQYKGLITRERIVNVFGSASIVQDVGSVIEIELAPNDYYLTEITRIVESTGVKILGTYIRTLEDNNKIVLTIKLNKQEVEGVLSALDRYGYTVFASYQLKSERKHIQDRYDHLMYLLNL